MKVLPLLFVFALPSVRVQPAPDSLDLRLAPLVKAHKGRVAIAVKDLKTGESYSLMGDEPMPTASLIKFPIMIELYLQVAQGKLKLSDMLTLRDQDKVQGSGILTYHFSDGATFSVRDATRLMIAFSDNTATNLILDRIGIASTNKRMATWDLPETQLNAKVYLAKKTSINPARSEKYGLGSTTAHETVRLLEKVYKGEVVSRQVCDEMLEHLKNCQFKETFRRFLPPGTVVAHKTGAVSAVRTDAGILYLKSGPVALCVLTADNADRSWGVENAGNVLCARVAQEVYRYFAARSKARAGAGKP
jgi:beta-lactamase class A